MRALRFLGIGVGVLVALFIVLLLAIKLFVHPNDYRGRIEQEVLHSTGRQLQLSGDLRLSVFPWVALELGPASLGNPAGFGTEPFATVQHVAFRVRLLPLLAKHLEIGRIEIDGLDLRLLKNAAGKGNWENFGSSEGTAPAATRSNGSSGAGMLRQVGGLIIKDSRFSYQDTVADHINLTTGSFESGVPMPVDLTVTLHPKGAPSAVIWKFTSPGIDLNMSAQTLDVPSFSTQFDKAQLTGSLHGKKVIDAPNLQGTFRLSPVSLRDLMTALGDPAPVMRDPKALNSFSASGEFAYGDNAARATALDVNLDDSHLQGQAAITNLDTDAMEFNLTLDQIDVDRYLSPPPSSGAKPPPAAIAAAPAETAAKGDPGAGFKKLQMKGSFTIGRLIVANLHLSQVKVGMDAKDGVMHVAPVTASLYDGSYTGDVTLTDTSTLGIRLQQTLNNVDVAKVLKDLAGTQRLSGHGNISTDLTGQGWDEPAILRTLNGHVAANLTNGAVEGVDLWFEINRAMALIQKQAMPAGNSSGRTKFDTFKASADLNQGVATTKDLVIASQNLHVAGQGSSNLVNDQVNYQVTATVMKNLPSATQPSGTKLADIPLTITGTMSSPEVRPDLEGMAKARLQQELNNHQDEIKQKVQDTLKGLFK